MRKLWFLALAVAVILPIIAFAADSTFFRYNSENNSWNRIKLLDNGDGTFSEQVAMITPGTAGLTYKLLAKESMSAPDSLTFTGTGTAWAFEVRGGSATFTVAGSSNIVVEAGKAFSSKFDPVAINPVLSLINLEVGATAQLIIEGGQ